MQVKSAPKTLVFFHLLVARLQILTEEGQIDQDDMSSRDSQQEESLPQIGSPVDPK
jgi:hypothetical protein